MHSCCAIQTIGVLLRPATRVFDLPRENTSLFWMTTRLCNRALWTASSVIWKISLKVGLCGPKLTGADGELQLSCRRFPTLIDKLARRLPLMLAQNVNRKVEMADWDHRTIRAVDYVIGACQVIRRRALQEVGLFDECIFYGPEDVDLCLRLQQAGWSVVYNPEAVIVHKERRMTRSLGSGLVWKHIYGLGYYFWKHGYLLSRKRLYSQLIQTRPFDQA